MSLKYKFILLAALQVSMMSFLACTKEEAQDPVEEGSPSDENAADIDEEMADANEAQTPADEPEQRISADEEISKSDTAATELESESSLETPADATSEASPLLDTVDQTEKSDSIVTENLASKDEAPSSDLKNEVGLAEETATPSDQDPSELEEIVAETTAPAADSAVQESAAEVPIAEVAPSGDTGEYVVRPGDTLAKIARAIYGSSRKWSTLTATNQLSDPNKIFPGDVITYPKDKAGKSFATAYKKEHKKTVIVKKNDTLYKIAAKVFGNGKYWKYLWSFNKTTIPDPNVLEVGKKLQYVDVKFSSKFAQKFNAQPTAPATTH